MGYLASYIAPSTKFLPSAFSSRGSTSEKSPFLMHLWKGIINPKYEIHLCTCFLMLYTWPSEQDALDGEIAPSSPGPSWYFTMYSALMILQWKYSCGDPVAENLLIPGRHLSLWTGEQVTPKASTKNTSAATKATEVLILLYTAHGSSKDRTEPGAW